MKVQLQNVLPSEIENRSMQIIEEECGKRNITLDPHTSAVVKRVIHTTADFDYAKNLVFANNAFDAALEALKSGANIFTDTKMAYSGINKNALEKLGCKAHCFISDEDIVKSAKEQGTTRAVAAVNKAMEYGKNPIFVIGNAPTALIRIYELIEEGKLMPALVVGVPVGFVNVIESKELILQTSVPAIVARGRKGGSNVAAAIINALTYTATGRTV